MDNVVSLDRARRMRALKRAKALMGRNEIYLEYPTAAAMSAWFSTEATLLFEPCAPMVIELPCDLEPA